MNEEQIMVFSKEWFEKHNKTLCWFANAPVIKYWFRWLLRIHNDIPFNVKINKISPNSFSYNAKKVGDKIELTTDFRTHEKFGKRLYYGLKPFWYLLHFWDWSTSVQPALNCGFDTLTVYPDAGTGNTTVDGYINREGQQASWSTLRSGAGMNANDTGAYLPLQIVASAQGSNLWDSIYRFIFTFDTSDLTSSSTVTAGTLSLYGVGKHDGLSITPNIDIYASTPTNSNALVAGDYSNVGSVSQTGSPITYANWSISSYNNFTLNSIGKGNISKTSISKFGARNANYDVSGTAPSWKSGLACYLSAYSSDQTGTTQDPKLVITYSLPTTFIPRTMWFN